MGEPNEPAIAGGSPREQYVREWGVLDQQYSTWRPRHEEVGRYLQPYRSRFLLTDVNQGQRKDNALINDTGIDAGLKLASAMSTGISSPVRTWDYFLPSDPTLADDDEVKNFCHEWQEVIAHIMARSGFYNMLFQIYQDLCGPAIGAGYIEPDDDEVINCTHFPVGQYRVATNAKGMVSRMFRLFSMTVGQIVEKFCTKPNGDVDLSRCSTRIKDSWKNGQRDTWIQLLHVIEPRAKRIYGAIDSKNKPWASNWMEWGSRNTNGQQSNQQQDFSDPKMMLYEGGSDEQPFCCGRWDVTGEDAYGQNSPGMLSIGDVKSLQILETTGAKFFAKGMDPAMNVPAALANASLLPGARNPLPANTNGAKFEPSYVPDRAWVDEVRKEKAQFEFRIRRAHFGDLLALISNDARQQPATAEEIRARKEERLLQLGGVFQRFGREVLTVLVNRVSAIAQRKGLGPPVPRKLLESHLRTGHGLRVEYENIFAQAQKAVGVSNVDATANFAIGLAKGGRPDALDKLNVDVMQDERAKMLGVKPAMLLNDEQVAKIRAQRAQAAQAKAQGEAMATAAPAVQKLSQTDPANLRDILQQFGPAAQAEGAGQGA